MEPATSPIVIVLVLAAVGAGLYAFWLTNRQTRRRRQLVAWLEAHHGDLWRALPWASRHLNRIGGVETLRRGGLGDDPAFMARYRGCKPGSLHDLLVILIGPALVGVILLGVRYLGWHW